MKKKKHFFSILKVVNAEFYQRVGRYIIQSSGLCFVLPSLISCRLAEYNTE